MSEGSIWRETGRALFVFVYSEQPSNIMASITPFIRLHSSWHGEGDDEDTDQNRRRSHAKQSSTSKAHAIAGSRLSQTHYLMFLAIGPFRKTVVHARRCDRLPGCVYTLTSHPLLYRSIQHLHTSEQWNLVEWSRTPGLPGMASPSSHSPPVLPSLPTPPRFPPPGSSASMHNSSAQEMAVGITLVWR